MRTYTVQNSKFTKSNSGKIIFLGFVIIALLGVHIRISHLLFDTEPVPTGMIHRSSKNILPATSDLDNWACENIGSAFSYIRRNNDNLVVHVEAVDGVDLDVQLYQEGINLEKGQIYVLRFCARADNATEIVLKASKDSKDYHDVGLHRTIILTPEWHAYCCYFEASNTVARHSRVPFFYLGRQKGRVWLSNIVLEHVTDQPRVVPKCFSSAEFYAHDIRIQCNYIADCSWSKWSTNHFAAVKNPGSSAYGALNAVRISSNDGYPDYIRPGEAAMGALGLMVGVQALDKNNSGYLDPERIRYMGVLALFFRWVNHVPNLDGSFPSTISYDTNGYEDLRPRGKESIGVTAQIIIAEYKYSEYFNDVKWLRDNWSLAEKAGSWLLNQPWNGQTVDESYRCAALHCLAAWASSVGKPDLYSQAADAGSVHLWEMADTAPGRYAFRRYLDGNSYPTYGGKFDNICYAPFETGALDEKMSRPGDSSGTPYGALISDWWTQYMTYLGNPSEGTLLMKYDAPNVWNGRLSPGGSLELAKVEWRVGRKDRARARFYWVARSSGLTNAVTEARVAGGILDWQQNSNLSSHGPKGAKTAAPWERFIDTSAYFIEVANMLWQDQDTKYIPERSTNNNN